MKLIVKQRVLGPRTFFVCILLIDLLHILALDMYTPALPSMQQEFGSSEAYLNQTVFSFLLVSAITMLFAGMISDRLGRKPPVVFGTVLFTLSSLGCVFAPDVNVLIVLRCGQAVGYGISSTIAPALLKDGYDDEGVKVMLSLMQSLVIIGPVLAPFLGSAMLALTDWRGIFAFLAACGALTIVLSLLITETLPAHARTREPLLATAKGMFIDARKLLDQPGFTSLTLYMSIGGIPFFAFIAVSSYIVLSEFGLGYLEYSLAYGAACLVNMVAPYVYLALSRRMNMTALAWLSTILVCVAAVLMVFAAPLGVVLLLVAFVPYALAEGIIRPAAYVELLKQPQTMVGTASAVSNFSYHVMTALATVVATLGWPTLLTGMGAIMTATAIVLVLFTVFCAKRWNLRS